MYVGRIVAAGVSAEGRAGVMYRVSSRSFPNREARLAGAQVSIMPKAGFESDLQKNPYIAYNCIRLAGDVALATNGSHTDPIIEKIATGMSVRDAMTLGLMAMDYEKDSYNTPRIAAAVNLKTKTSFLGIVRKDAVIVREFEFKPGTVYYVCTYERNAPCENYKDEAFSFGTAADACKYVFSKGAFAELENPVCSTVAFASASGNGFEFAALNP